MENVLGLRKKIITFLRTAFFSIRINSVVMSIRIVSMSCNLNQVGSNAVLGR